MWVVKLGGSLSTDPALPAWLELLAGLGSGRVVIVPGGGGLADEVRRLQSHWAFDDLPAHNMAILAMAQNAYLMQALQPGLQIVCAEVDIVRVLRLGRTALWAPLVLLRQTADETTNWDVTSDSIALALARHLNAERLVVVKRCEVGNASAQELVDQGVLDLHFAQLAHHAAFPIDVIDCDAHQQVRSLLLGDTRMADR
ncbi:amino acid kinase family protein [Sphaerotilus hippei]|uniref:Amino acid kinase family protein n=1 Tax=Sphaerotilus hippei TaxID=744406 RepID=A0A318GUR2_9BURK|nr:aspartate kinase [Sphaerotilus hippei]PXW91568.1 amino acid kinase family protein [Sphaerotilus hippei]